MTTPTFYMTRDNLEVLGGQPRVTTFGWSSRVDESTIKNAPRARLA